MARTGDALERSEVDNPEEAGEETHVFCCLLSPCGLFVSIPPSPCSALHGV